MNLNETLFEKSLWKIYTQTGDCGTSALLSRGTRCLPNDSLVFDVLGTLDELSSVFELFFQQAHHHQYEVS